MRQNKRKALVLAVMGLFGSGLACAVEVPPNAGLIGTTVQKPEALPKVTKPRLQIDESTVRSKVPAGAESGDRVTLKGVVFEGVADLGSANDPKLLEIVQAYLGKTISFSELMQLTDQVTTYYRQQGYILAQAVLQPKALKDGVLTVTIIPGRYDKAAVSIKGNADRGITERLVTGATPTGDIVEKEQLERLSLLLNEVPGMSASVTMKPGSQAGTSALDVQVEEGKRFGGYIGADNEGLTTTGRARVMAGAYANNILGSGDQLRVDLMDAVENSGVFTGSVDYSLLAGNYGTRVGINASHLTYQYLLSGSSYMGYSTNGSLYVNHPWVRTASARIDARLEGGIQSLTDFYPDIMFGGGTGRKDIPFVTGSLLGSVALVPGGVTGFRTSVMGGDLQYKNDIARFISSADVVDTVGGFTRWSYQLNHDQLLTDRWSVYGNVYGQYSDKNLDSSQKMLLGGPVGVRAYDTGTGSVTNGTVATLELRSKWFLPESSWAGSGHQLTVAGFYDQGWGQQFAQNSTPYTAMLSRANNVDLAGAGIYAKVGRVNDYNVVLTWAQRTGAKDPVSGSNATNQFWVTATKAF